MFICNRYTPTRITIPNIPNSIWATEKDVYLHLYTHADVRASLWEEVNNLRQRGYPIAYIDHDILTQAIPIFLHDTEDDLCYTLYNRISQPREAGPFAEIGEPPYTAIPKTISIIVPFGQTWKNENDIYHHLLDSQYARRNLLYRADTIRHHHNEIINAEHDLLKVPLTLTPGMTDAQLVVSITACREHYLQTL